MKVIGVTGGTGSGKSTVSQILEAKGAVVLDADRIAKELQKKGTATFDKIVETFGKGVIDGATGELDRKALGKIVFENKEKRLLLNKIVHGEVNKVVKKRLEILKEDHAGIVVLDVPIPTEEGFFDVVNTVWAVVANDDLRIERIMSRCNISEHEAEMRIASQMSNREYSELADVVIDNEGSEEDLKRLVEYELQRFL